MEEAGKEMGLDQGRNREDTAEYEREDFRQSYLDCLEACILLIRNVVTLHGALIHRRWHFFFHLFSACVCLAAAVIRAPLSSLNQTLLSELEMGLILFRTAQRDDVVSVRSSTVGRR